MDQKCGHAHLRNGGRRGRHEFERRSARRSSTGVTSPLLTGGLRRLCRRISRLSHGGNDVPPRPLSQPPPIAERSRPSAGGGWGQFGGRRRDWREYGRGAGGNRRTVGEFRRSPRAETEECGAKRRRGRCCRRRGRPRPIAPGHDGVTTDPGREKGSSFATPDSCARYHQFAYG